MANFPAARLGVASLFLTLLTLMAVPAMAAEGGPGDNCPTVFNLDQIDTDSDGFGDVCDNCSLTANASQRDADADGFGNVCDADYNNDRSVNFLDFAVFQQNFLTTNAIVDLDGNGIVNFIDFARFVAMFQNPPGPAGGILVQSSVSTEPFTNAGYRVLAANDLGMHCADLDYQVFSILPPFNIVHAQLVRRGTSNSLPELVVPSDSYEMVYSAVANPNDPALGNPAAAPLSGTARALESINSSSHNDAVIPMDVFKSNFWTINPDTGNSFGFDSYSPLYPGGILGAFSPIPAGLGLPVPDPAALPGLVVGQQAMPAAIGHSPYIANPYRSNAPQAFDRIDLDLSFFTSLPFGGVIPAVNWWAADGIPIFPVDDAGRSNAYPLMRIQAREAGTVLATTDIVIPVASEADCQLCHAVPEDCTDPRLPLDIQSLSCNGAAVAPTQYTQTNFLVTRTNDAPGATVVQRLLNAAKLNILRLHDARHGAAYTNSVGDASPCNPADVQDGNCIVNQAPVQCSQCHYSPALDLTQAGPQDDPSNLVKGMQQTRHISMSRAMHFHHGEFTDLFPALPPPIDNNGNIRSEDLTNDILEQTCYACHPGKRTRCLRGTMFDGGMVCQDCHGGMQQVGDDFSASFPTLPFPAGANLDKRVPWASEPGCQACHTGDAINNLAGTPGTVVSEDGLRLLQAWLDTDPSAAPIQAVDQRFAEDQSLYRLSKGHGGIMCEGCHGTTHAIWPNPQPEANDNVTAKQLQGFRGTVTECTVCHEPTEDGLPIGLGGPHGMHPLADYSGPDHRWNDDHESVFEDLGAAACQTCHGAGGEGTPISRTAADRLLECKNENGTHCPNHDELITIPKGTPVSCGMCHENYILFPDNRPDNLSVTISDSDSRNRK